MPSDWVEQFFRARPRLIERLFEKALASLPFLQTGLSRDTFLATLCRSLRHRFAEKGVGTPREAGAHEAEQYLDALHLEDLALACACSEGHEQAWEHFILNFRPQLYAAARAIVAGQSHGASARGEQESTARELADSIYAELYGLGPASAEPGSVSASSPQARRSLFLYFYGRSKLSTWLRAVLAQRHVDAFRASRHLESLEGDGGEAGAESAEKVRGRLEALPAASQPLPDADRARYLTALHAALADALRALAPRDRLRLSLYYVQDLTLAQIGRILGEHEATVSRKLDRVRDEMRKRVEQTLRDAKGPARFSEAQIQLCFEYALEEWPFDLTHALETEAASSGSPQAARKPARVVLKDGEGQ